MLERLYKPTKATQAERESGIYRWKSSILANMKVFFDETFRSIERRTPGPIYTRRENDPNGIFNKTPDIDTAVARLRQCTIIEHPFSIDVEGYKISGRMNLPAVLVSARINPKITFEQREVAYAKI